MQDIKRIRKRVWYERFLKVVEYFEKDHSVEELVWFLWNYLDTHHAFGTRTVADSAALSLCAALGDSGYSKELPSQVWWVKK